MANNCYYRVNFSAPIESKEILERIAKIFDGEDDEYILIRFWYGTNGGIKEHDDGTCQIMIDGECPWTAQYMWDPDSTINGRDVVGTKSSDGRTFTSIPEMCKMWGLIAWGDDLEEGCEWCNDYSCDEYGKVTQTDRWADYVKEMYEQNDDPMWEEMYNELKEKGAYSN